MGAAVPARQTGQTALSAAPNRRKPENPPAAIRAPQRRNRGGVCMDIRIRTCRCCNAMLPHRRQRRLCCS
eukprot:15458325-Alexandrium_andersonii.AAC.1